MSEYTETDRERLTTEKILELWSKTYNSEGKPDWSHIFPYYHPDIVFQDTIQRLEGIDSFKSLFQELGEAIKKLLKSKPFGVIYDLFKKETKVVKEEIKKVKKRIIKKKK